MYYVIEACGVSEDYDETIPFETKEAAVECLVNKANETINYIVRRGYRPDVTIREMLYDGKIAFGLSFVALTMPKNLIMDTYDLYLTKD